MAQKVNQELRAFKAWPILTERADKKKNITYEELANALGTHPRALRFVLDIIQDYCLKNQLPPLTILVVRKNTRLPSSNFLTHDIEDYAVEKKDVLDFKWSKLENPFIYAESGSTEEELIKALIDFPEKSEVVYTKVKVRGMVQQLFRNALLEIYANSCAFCGLTIKEALEACHIIPYSESSIKQRLDITNGLLLCSNHHKLFDNGYLRVNEKYYIQYFNPNEIKKELSNYDKLNTIKIHKKKISLPKNTKHFPSLEYLKKHQKNHQ
jgi:putative restriction endonuclease